MLNITKLYDLTSHGIRELCMKMLLRLQKEQPSAVVGGIAALFLMICDRYAVDPRRVLEITDRVLRDARDKHPVEMRAMARYIREELK